MTRSDYLTEAATRHIRDRNTYATDGKCHNAEPGTYGHECGKIVDWIGTNANGWQCGYCDDCKSHGFECRSVVSWKRVP